MKKIITEKSVLANWYTLILEAEQKTSLVLNDKIESYTIFLLIRFTERAEFAKSVIAIDFLKTLNLKGQQQRNELQILGDKCLLLSGLFPEIATKKRVNVNYFMSMGQNAYQQLYYLESYRDNDQIYGQLTESFPMITKVLGAMRDISKLDNNKLYKL